ncbi:MAG: glutamine-hydrolyzing carbamoyl-phosphate synthase small subunit [Solirubrobacteraceae bacterium]
MTRRAAYVMLEDGARFDGIGCAADDIAVGEIVFTTSMSGYQEAVTDPSYAGQLLVFTYPQIGNYGVRSEAMESDRIHAGAAIMRAAVDRKDSPRAEQGWLAWLKAHGIPAITEVDTRALVRHIRSQGAMRGGLFPGQMSERQARALIEAEPPMTGRDLVGGVTSAQRTVFEGPGPRVAILDTGVKRSIVSELRSRGVTVELHPSTATARQLLEGNPDAVLLANGPGDPAALAYIVEVVRQLIGRVPLYGICLGHQLLCQAVGLETYKLAFGHHGANHPVKDLVAGTIEITSQNHGFAVLGPDGSPTIEGDDAVRWETEYGAAELTHINLYDRTVEGLTLCEVPAATVQYHPEAGPGPHDALHLFDRLVEGARAA